MAFSIPLPQVKLKPKNIFNFDSKEVIRAFDRATINAMKRFGAFTMQEDKRSIRKRQKPSKPGSPPTWGIRKGPIPKKKGKKRSIDRSHEKGKLRNTIGFNASLSTRSVVVGPMAFKRSTNILEVIETGGVVTKRIRRRRVRIPVEARPHTEPAFEKKLPEFPKLWANSVRR